MVTLQLRARQGRLEALNQVGRRDDLDAVRTHHLDRARIDARYLRNRASGRVVHRDSPRALEHGAERREHLVMRPVNDLVCAERVEPMRLDCRDDRRRLSVRGHEAEPSPRREAVVGKFEDSISERVAHPEMVEEPSVESRGPRCVRNVVESRHAGLKRAPHACTCCGSIFTIGLCSGVNVIPRYWRYFSRSARSATMYSCGSSTTRAVPRIKT